MRTLSRILAALAALALVVGLPFLAPEAFRFLERFDQTISTVLVVASLFIVATVSALLAAHAGNVLRQPAPVRPHARRGRRKA